MARFIDGEVTDARLGFMADLAGGRVRHGCGRLCHDQRYFVVTAIAAEPVLAAEFQRQPGCAGRHAEHHATPPAVAVPGWFTVAGFRIALR